MEATGGGIPRGDLKSKAYHISQGAIEVCNRWGMEPSATIEMMAIELARGPEATERLVLGAVRQVCQVEGIMLHEKQKGFFKELAVGMMRYLKGDEKRE